MPFTNFDVLYVGLQRRSYIAAIDASQLWEKSNIQNARVSITYFDSTFFRAAEALLAYADAAIIYVANEVDLPLTIRQAACRKWIEILSARKEKPLIVLHEDCLDLVDEFAAHSYTVDLRPDEGTIEAALKSVTSKLKKRKKIPGRNFSRNAGFLLSRNTRGLTLGIPPPLCFKAKARCKTGLFNFESNRTMYA